MPATQQRILVPVQDPARESDLVRLAASLAAGPWAELHLVHVMTPRSAPAAEAATALERLARIALDMGVGAIAHVETADDVVVAITAALRRWNCNTMVLEWSGQVRPEAVLAASNRAVTKAGDVDTLIFKNRGFSPARRLCVPTGGGSHAMMGIQIAAELRDRWGAELRIIRVARDRRCRPGDPVLARYCEQLRADTQLQLRMLGVEAPVQIIPARDVVGPIVQEARECDLVVLGASNDWRQDGFLAGSIPDEITRRVACSVLMVRAGATEKLSLGKIFYDNTIRLDLHPADKWEAIEALVDVLVEEKQVPPSERAPVRDAAFARERARTTAMGHGTAIPHAPLLDLPGILGAMAICPEGVDFGGPGEEPVRFVFLLVTPQENYRNYIPVLSQIAAVIRPPDNRAALLACQTPSEVAELLRRVVPR